jgi:hypothetical protein
MKPERASSFKQKRNIEKLGNNKNRVYVTQAKDKIKK